jgi:hypothetical protein
MYKAMYDTNYDGMYDKVIYYNSDTGEQTLEEEISQMVPKIEEPE